MSQSFKALFASPFTTFFIFRRLSAVLTSASFTAALLFLRGALTGVIHSPRPGAVMRGGLPLIVFTIRPLFHCPLMFRSSADLLCVLPVDFRPPI
uniref:Secreted protein n=1 Tax=Knipowitschia caucasica TaxID=637954 RepID=A0AAV2LLL3_KNICA